MSEKLRYIHTCVYECVGVALCVVWVEEGGGGGEGGYVLIHMLRVCGMNGQFM